MPVRDWYWVTIRARCSGLSARADVVTTVVILWCVSGGCGGWYRCLSVQQSLSMTRLVSQPLSGRRLVLLSRRSLPVSLPSLLLIFNCVLLSCRVLCYEQYWLSERQQRLGQMYNFDAVRDKDELFIFWGQKVKGQGDSETAYCEIDEVSTREGILSLAEYMDVFHSMKLITITHY